MVSEGRATLMPIPSLDCCSNPRRPERPPGPVHLKTILVEFALARYLTRVLWAIPMHDRLDHVGRSDATIDSLLRANLLRTAALTTSTLALVWTVWRGSGGSGAARS